MQTTLTRDKEIIARLDAVIIAAAETLKLHCFNCGTRYETASTNNQWDTCPSCGESIT